MESNKATIIRNLLAAGIPYEIIHEVAKSIENDETDTNEPDHLDLLDDNLDMVYDDDVAYEPIDDGDKSDSEDSYTSAEGEEDSDDETEQENMD